MSWEAMLPLGIISAMIFVMGSSQYVIHTTIYGKPKHPRHDAWDRAMDERDARLKEEYEKSQVSVLFDCLPLDIIGIGATAYPRFRQVKILVGFRVGNAGDQNVAGVARHRE